MIDANVVPITDQRVRISPAATDSYAGSSVLVKNTHATVTVYLGPPTVTAATGYPLEPGDIVSVDLSPVAPTPGQRITDEALHGITATGETGQVNYLASGV